MTHEEYKSKLAEIDSQISSYNDLIMVNSLAARTAKIQIESHKKSVDDLWNQRELIDEEYEQQLWESGAYDE